MFTQPALLLRLPVLVLLWLGLAACTSDGDSPTPQAQLGCPFTYDAALGTPTRYCLDFVPVSHLAASDELYGFSRRYTTWRTHPTLVAQVQQLTAGLTDTLAKVKAIANWVVRSRPYSPDLNSPTNADAELDDIVHADRGICFDASFISTAMLRIAGIAAFENFVGPNHANTAYRVNGVWRVFDATFCADLANCPDLDFSEATLAAPRIHFLHLPTGNHPSGSAYCEGSSCLPYPFTTNRLLALNWPTAQVRVALPALTITSNQEIPRDGSRGQIRYLLTARTLRSDLYGGYFDTRDPDVWGLVDVGLYLNRLQNGYVYLSLPVSSPSGEPMTYRYEAVDLLNNRLVASYTFSLTEGEGRITWAQLAAEPGAPAEHVAYAREELRKRTEALGLEP